MRFIIVALALMAMFSTASAADCAKPTYSGPAGTAIMPIVGDEVCKCGDTAECGSGKYCVQPDLQNLDKKPTCTDIPQCYQNQKADEDCYCQTVDTPCAKGNYCTADGTSLTSPYKCTPKDVCGGMFQADGQKKITEDCMCRLDAGGTVECAKDKYCSTGGCTDKPLDVCKDASETALKAACSCGQLGTSCAKGKFCYAEDCHDTAAHTDHCTANSEICFTSQTPCAMDLYSQKDGVSLDLCVKATDDKNKYIKWTCVKDGELASQEYSDKDCKTTTGAKATYKQGECQMGLAKYSWSGKCGGVSSSGSIATLLTFALTALITFL